MALLLAMFQKMRLTRELNQATYELTKYSSKLTRVQKNITNVEKMYTRKKANIEKEAKQKVYQGKLLFNQMSGLGPNDINLNQGYYFAAGQYAITSTYQLNMVKQLLLQGQKDKDGNTINNFENSNVDNTIAYYQQHAHLWKVDENGQPIKNDDGSFEPIEGVTQEQAQFFMNTVSQAKSFEYTQRNKVATVSADWENSVSIWSQAAQEQLEAEQDAALEDLHYQETMWELEKTELETKIERLRAEKDSYDKLVSNEIKDAAPKFGLG